jgi:hypothetical protein
VIPRVPALRVLVLGLAAAGGLAAAAAAADPTTDVRGVTVVGGAGAAGEGTYPGPGDSVPGGVMILKVVFDQPMTPGAWAYGRAAGADLPACLANPRLLADQHTFVLLCTVAASHAYAVEINPAPRFASAYGRSAQPYVLKFATTADITTGLHQALTQAGLADTDDPIMTPGVPGPQGSQTAPPE